MRRDLCATRLMEVIPEVIAGHVHQRPNRRIQ
jgi:hypothetical protein